MGFVWLGWEKRREGGIPRLRTRLLGRQIGAESAICVALRLHSSRRLQLDVSHYNVSVTIEMYAAHPERHSIQEETYNGPRKNCRETIALASARERQRPRS